MYTCMINFVVGFVKDGELTNMSIDNGGKLYPDSIMLQGGKLNLAYSSWRGKCKGDSVGH